MPAEAIEYLPAMMTVMNGFQGAQAQSQEGIAIAQGLEFKARQEQTAAGQAIAAEQRQAQAVGVQGDYALSTLIAHAVAQGGSATDPGVLNLYSRIQNEAAYKQAVSLYQGQEKARVLTSQAQQDLIAARAESAAYGAKSRATLMGAEMQGMSMLAKYGGDSPAKTNIDTFGAGANAGAAAGDGGGFGTFATSMG